MLYAQGMTAPHKHKRSLLPRQPFAQFRFLQRMVFQPFIGTFVNSSFIIHSWSSTSWNEGKWKCGKVLLIASLYLSLLPLITFIVPTSCDMLITRDVPVAVDVPIISTSLLDFDHICFFRNPFWLAPTRLVPCHHNLALNMPASLKIASLMTDIVTFYVPLIQYFLKFLMTIRFLKNRKITSLFEYIILFHTEINSVSLLCWIIVSLLRCH